MDAQLKAKWVEALRSGEYKQAKGKLHDTKNDAFCCLGVLCKVMGAEFGPGQEEKENEDEDGMYMDTYDYVPVLNGRVLSSNDDEELKDSFCKEIGIPHQFDLIELNDGRGKLGDDNYKAPAPFSEIADYIEKNL
jgi:hypothetical protein